jgi:hypothetical protein
VEQAVAFTDMRQVPARLNPSPETVCVSTPAVVFLTEPGRATKHLLQLSTRTCSLKHLVDSPAGMGSGGRDGAHGSHFRQLVEDLSSFEAKFLTVALSDDSTAVFCSNSDGEQ